MHPKELADCVFRRSLSVLVLFCVLPRNKTCDLCLITPSLCFEARPRRGGRFLGVALRIFPGLGSYEYFDKLSLIAPLGPLAIGPLHFRLERAQTD